MSRMVAVYGFMGVTISLFGVARLANAVPFATLDADILSGVYGGDPDCADCDYDGLKCKKGPHDTKDMGDGTFQCVTGSGTTYASCKGVAKDAKGYRDCSTTLNLKCIHKKICTSSDCMTGCNAGSHDYSDTICDSGSKQCTGK